MMYDVQFQNQGMTMPMNMPFQQCGPPMGYPYAQQPYMQSNMPFNMPQNMQAMPQNMQAMPQNMQAMPQNMQSMPQNFVPYQQGNPQAQVQSVVEPPLPTENPPLPPPPPLTPAPGTAVVSTAPATVVPVTTVPVTAVPATTASVTVSPVTASAGQVTEPGSQEVVMEAGEGKEEGEVEDGELEDDEFENSVERVVAATTYEERIEMVGEILSESLPTIDKKSHNFTRTLNSGKVVKLTRLPASEGFPGKFKEFVNELSAGEGSEKAKDTKDRSAYAVGRLPTLKTPKFKRFYDIADCPWPTNAPPFQNSILKSYAYPRSNPPTPICSLDRLMAWEAMNRRCVSMMSHVDHFMASSSKLFETIYDECEDGTMSDERAWNLSRMGINMTFSAAMGIQDVVKTLMWEIGEQVMTRRDQFLKEMQKGYVPDDLIKKLRFCDINGPDLFDADILQEAKDKAEKKKNSKTQSDLLEKVVESTENKNKKPPRPDLSKKKTPFKVQSFQNEKSEVDDDKGEPSTSARGGSGGRGRGRGASGAFRGGGRGGGNTARFNTAKNGNGKKKQFANRGYRN